MKNFIKYIRVKLYNTKHKTKISSYFADLRAEYGCMVRVGKNTIVTKDVFIDDYSYINTNSYIENCIIGKYCSISSGVFISPFEHNYKYKSTHPFLYNKEYGFVEQNEYFTRPKVIIGNDVLISLNVIILEGVRIGDGAIIAAGAVVTKDVKPYEIVGGVPAKHIKFRFDDVMIEEQFKDSFWEWDKNTIINNIDYLKNKSKVKNI